MEIMKNLIEGTKVVGKKIVKPAIGVTVAGLTTLTLYLIGKHARSEETEVTETEAEGLDENQEESEEEIEIETETEEDEEA